MSYGVATATQIKCYSALNGSLLNSFNAFYITATGLFAFFLVALALIPATAKKTLGPVGESRSFPIFPGSP